MVDLLERCDRALGHCLAALSWLALPVVGLLFLQWPLRDGVRAFSREANDLGQVCFALFVAASIAAASRAGGHLATDVVAARYTPRRRALFGALATLAGPVPWALFVLWTGRPILGSIAMLERFQDTDDPGYFLVKGALLLGAALILTEAAIRLGRMVFSPIPEPRP